MTQLIPLRLPPRPVHRAFVTPTLQPPALRAINRRVDRIATTTVVTLSLQGLILVLQVTLIHHLLLYR